MFENKSISHTGNALLLEGIVDGRWCCMTIDTGSDMTIARPDVVQKGSIDWNPEMEWMSTVTGARAPIHGRGRLMLEMGDLQIQHDVVVADIKDEFILGTDFLTPNRCLVDLKNGVLSINDNQVPLMRLKQMKTPTCSKVTLDSTVDLPLMSEAVACGKLLGKPENMTWGIIEPDTLQSKPLDDLLVGRSLIDIDAERVPVRLLNLTNQPKRIKQGTTVAICNPIKSVLAEQIDVGCCNVCCCGSDCNEGKSCSCKECKIGYSCQVKRDCSCTDSCDKRDGYPYTDK